MRNENKELCMKCKYQGRIGTRTKDAKTASVTLICNYIEITGHPRILECYDPTDCTCFKPGKKQNMNRAPKRNKKK